MVKIITDSASDIPKEIAQDLDIMVVPIHVIIDSKEYKDNIDIFPSQLYEYMESGKDVKTAQITTYEYLNYFNTLDKNYEYIWISFSSGLSSTYQSGKVAEYQYLERNPDFKIAIIDSLNVTLPLALYVIEAAKMAKSGESFDNILEFLNRNKERVKIAASVETLDYLLKGGRISKTQAIVGSVLNIKPILKMDELGKLQVIDKVRGNKKKKQRLLKFFNDNVERIEDVNVAISHGNNLAEANELKEELEKLGVKNFLISDLGATIGAHTGPGIVVLGFVNFIR